MGSLLGFQRRQAFPEPVISPFPGVSVFGGSSGLNGSRSTDQALAVPAAYACIALLTNTISSLSLRTYRKGAGGRPDRQIDDPPLLVNPSGSMTQAQWIAMVVMSLLTAGNTYGRKIVDDNQRAQQIVILSPENLVVTMNDDGTLTFKDRKTQKEIPASSIWHLPGLCLPGQSVGLSPIAYAAATLGIDISSRKFASDFFDGGGIPKAVLTTDQPVDQTKAKTIKDRFLASIRGREPMVFGNGVKYQQISVRPEESQFLKTQEANVAQVARFFSVPPEMVGGAGGHTMTYSNVEQRSIDFLTYCIAPWLVRIEQSISQLLPLRVYVKFDTADLLRTDAETAAKIAVQHIAAKILAPSEIREQMGLPPMTAAQKIEADMVPLTVTPLGGAKALPGLKLPPGAVAPVPADDSQPADPQGP